MDIQQLKVFVSVAETLNFTQTAKLFHLTQPAVSHQINSLEQGLNAKLINRTSHEVSLTSAGQVFYEYAINLIDLAKQAESKIFNISTGKDGEIKLFAVQTEIETVVECISTFSARYPDIQVDIEFGTGIQQLKAINNNNYDFYFSFESLLQSVSTLNFMPTSTNKFSLLVNNKDLPNIDVNDFSTLEDLDLVSYIHEEGPFLVNRVFDICARRNYTVKNIRWVKTFPSIIISVNAGLGFSILPETVVDSCYTKNVTFIPIPDDDATVTSAVGWSKTSNNSAVACFLEVIKELYLKK